jgi:Flp pilus assembly protein TadG
MVADAAATMSGIGTRITARARQSRFVQRFVRAQGGAAAVEFALVAAPFLALLFAIIETALVFFAGQTLEYAVTQSGRLIMTGQADAGGFDQTAFKNQVCARIIALFDCENTLYVNVQKSSTFASASTATPYDAGGQFDKTKMSYDPGNPGDIVVVSVYYQWPIYVSLFGDNLSNQSGGNRLLVATSVFRNEPYK